MKLHGKNWDGEWEPAAASWFKTVNGWRLAYGEPIEDRPIGGFDPVWAKFIVNVTYEPQQNICEKHVRCKYDTQVDAYGCHATYKLFDTNSLEVASVYHHMGRHQLPDQFIMDVDSSNFVNGFRWEDVGFFMLMSGSDGYNPDTFTWESQNAEGFWIQRGSFRSAPCYSAQTLMLTDVNPGFISGTKSIEYVKYEWDCPMTKTKVAVPIEE
jgi:hypothetical protein